MHTGHVEEKGGIKKAGSLYITFLDYDFTGRKKESDMRVKKGVKQEVIRR